MQQYTAKNPEPWRCVVCNELHTTSASVPAECIRKAKEIPDDPPWFQSEDGPIYDYDW